MKISRAGHDSLLAGAGTILSRRGQPPVRHLLSSTLRPSGRHPAVIHFALYCTTSGNGRERLANCIGRGDALLLGLLEAGQDQLVEEGWDARRLPRGRLGVGVQVVI